jgi:hypothetical protein
MTATIQLTLHDHGTHVWDTATLGVYRYVSTELLQPVLPCSKSVEEQLVLH